MDSTWKLHGLLIPITIILIMIVSVSSLSQLDEKKINNSELVDEKSCKISFTESIPDNMTYDKNATVHRSTFLSWMDLINSAGSTIEIASLYWTMKRKDDYPHDSAEKGEDVYEALVKAGRDRGIVIKVATNKRVPWATNSNVDFLINEAKAKVRVLNFTEFLGGGVLHTKLWLVDRKNFYLGSANMDWRSLTQVKELGIVGINCPTIANDLGKIFEVYWKLGAEKKIPAKWPDELGTEINMNNPMNLIFDENNYRAFFASSPAPLSPRGRTNDIDAILHCIEKAEKFVYISVMDYFPLTIFTPKVKYWPVIDNALRSAAIDRKITVRLLISWWKQSRTSEGHFLQSLVDLTSSYKNVKIEVKRFIVPKNADSDKIPASRVNHNKFMVTDIAAYIGTSNWSGDYFIEAAGIGMVFEDVGVKNKESIRQQLEEIFLRDWNSPYAYSLNASCLNHFDDQYKL